MTDYERIKREYDLSLLEKNKLTDKVWPVGSIYMSLDATDPAVRFGGVWERIQNAFLLAAGDAHPAGETGGEEQHTLSLSEMPGHYHSDIHCAIGQHLTAVWDMDNVTDTTQAAGISTYNTGNPSFPYRTDTRGGNQPHNNMPPYLAVYIWKRIK